MINEGIKSENFIEFASDKIYADVSTVYHDSTDLAITSDLIVTTFSTAPDPDKHISDFLPNTTTYSRVANYMDDLEEIMIDNSDSLDVGEIVQLIEGLEQQAYDDSAITNDDLLIIYPATSIAKASLKYWDENFKDWEDYAGTTLTSRGTPPGKRLARIAAMDVAGGVAGAVSLWAVNVFVGVGQVTYAGAIIGGAVSTSVVEAGYEIFSSIWGD